MSWQYNPSTGEWWDDEGIYHQTAVDQFYAPRDPTPGEARDALDYHQPIEETQPFTVVDELDDAVIGRREDPRPGEVSEEPRRGFDIGARGIDVARYQGAPNWAKVAAAGISFAYVKANEGTSTSYPTTNDQVMGASKAGLKVGLYHYAKPGLSPEASADAFAAVINKFAGLRLPPCLDLEEGSGQLGAWAKAFIARLRARTGIKRVMLYSGAAFFRDQIREDWMDSDVLLWIAHYGPAPGQPRYLTPRVAIHQHSSTGRIDGIVGNVDLNHAIWPLDKIIGGSPAAVGEDDMTPDERKMLIEVHATVTRPLKAWPGGGTGDPGVEAYTPLQYMLRSNVEQLQTRHSVSALTRQVAELTSTVAALLKALQSPPEQRQVALDPEDSVTNRAG